MHEIELRLKRKIKARLYLNAVLPAFEDLVEFSQEAKILIGKRVFNLGFQTSRGLKSTLQFSDQSCTFTKSSELKRHIVLHFISEDQLIREFEDDGFRLPIPVKGASRVKEIKIFKALALELDKCLRPSEEALRDSNFHQFHVTLQLGIALRSAIELAKHEPLSKQIMKTTPDGLAHFSIGEEDFGAWIRWENGRLVAGKGKAPEEPSVRVQFRDADTALQAIGNQIDVMAALGLGQIKISGLTPLADSLGYIFERIPLYIEP